MIIPFELLLTHNAGQPFAILQCFFFMNESLKVRFLRGVSGVYWALFIFELLACYHQNLGLFWGVWLFQNFFLPKKVTLPRQKHIFKIQWEIHFFFKAPDLKKKRSKKI